MNSNCNSSGRQVVHQLTSRESATHFLILKQRFVLVQLHRSVKAALDQRIHSHFPTATKPPVDPPPERSKGRSNAPTHPHTETHRENRNRETFETRSIGQRRLFTWTDRHICFVQDKSVVEVWIMWEGYWYFPQSAVSISCAPK